MMSAVAHAGFANKVCHTSKKTAFFGSQRAALKAAPVRLVRSKAVAARADKEVWNSMSSFMKNKCKEAAALEAKDKEAGRAAWIELDKSVPGARLAYFDSADAESANGMENFCDGNDNAQECKVFE
jgi:hypothetical protein